MERLIVALLAVFTVGCTTHRPQILIPVRVDSVQRPTSPAVMVPANSLGKTSSAYFPIMASRVTPKYSSPARLIRPLY